MWDWAFWNIINEDPNCTTTKGGSLYHQIKSMRASRSISLCKTMDLPTCWSPERWNVLRLTEGQRNYHYIIIAYSLHFCLNLLCLCFDLITLQTSCQRNVYIVNCVPSSKVLDGSYCTISVCKEHTFINIWAYFRPPSGLCAPYIVVANIQL